MKIKTYIFSFLFVFLNFSTCFGYHLMSKQDLENLIINSRFESEGNTLSGSASNKHIDDSSEKASENAAIYFDRIKRDVKKRYFSWIATQFQYPTCIEANCREFQVKTPEELLKYKEQIFTPNIIDAILSQSRDNLFYRNDAYMIGAGEIWFVPGYLHGVTNNSGYSVGDCSTAPLLPLPQKYYGTWELYRLQGDNGRGKALSELKGNNTIQILKDSFINKTNVMEPSMDKVEWLFETETGESDEDFGSKCNLIWYDLPEAIPNKIITIYACSGGQKHLYLEVTAQDELAYFYNGLFYVFKKVKS